MKDYDNFFLPSDDLNEARSFYSKILGLRVKFDFSARGMIAFAVGDQEPAIILKDINMIRDAKPAIWFVVDNLNEIFEDLERKGVRFLSAPFPIQTGMAVEFEDPFGNRLGITEYSIQLAPKPKN